MRLDLVKMRPQKSAGATERFAPLAIHSPLSLRLNSGYFCGDLEEEKGRRTNRKVLLARSRSRNGCKVVLLD